MANPLTRQDVEDLALLARLALRDDEVRALTGELCAILEHMDALAELDTDGVEPMTHAVPMTLRLREDVAGESLPAEVALGSAPAREDDYFQVPNIIKTAAQSKGEE